jgi:hypothetical protein
MCKDPLGANDNIQMVRTHGAWRVTTAESGQTADCPMKGPTICEPRGLYK